MARSISITTAFSLLAIFVAFALDGIAALGALAVLGFHGLDGLAADAHLLADFGKLCLQRRGLGIELRELAGQDDAQFRAHFVAQLGIALGLAGLALQRIHLPRHFVEDVVDARQVQLGVFQTRFRQPLAGLELGDAGGLFDDGATVGRLAAENLSDAALLDDRVGLGPEPGAHEDVLNVAQPAKLSVQQILALAGAEQASRYSNLSRLEGADKLAAADLQYYVRS